jgi:hypothetical protein
VDARTLNAPTGYATVKGPEWSASLQWEGRTQQTAARHLWFAGRAVDYCLFFGPQGSHPPTVPTT